MTVRRAFVVIAALSAAAAVVFGVSGGAGATPPPVEMSYACAVQGNGLMRYATAPNQCKSSETSVTIRPGPVLVCVNGDYAVRKVSSFTGCPVSQRLTLPPPTNPVYFCVLKVSNLLRRVDDPSKCKANEFPVVVPIATILRPCSMA